MPLFEYVCRSCGHRFEALVHSGSTAACPNCNSSRLERQLSSFAVLNRSPRAHCEGDAACVACCDGAGSGQCPLK